MLNAYEYRFFLNGETLLQVFKYVVLFRFRAEDHPRRTKPVLDSAVLATSSGVPVAII